MRRRGLPGRALRFLLKASARAVGAVLLFIVLCSLAVYLTLRGMIDSEEVKALLVDQLQEALHRPVQIEGVVLTPRGVKLKNLRIIERLDIPGHTLLDSDFVLITIKPLPLLRGAVRLKSVILVSPRISVVRNEWGEWSVSDIFSSTAPASMKWGPFLLRSLAADRTRIENGLLRVDDRQGFAKHVVERFGLTLEGFSLERPFGFDVSFDNVSSAAGTDIATSWQAKGLVNLASLDFSQAAAVAPKFVVTVDGFRVEGSAGLRRLDDPEMDLSFKLPEVTRSRWPKYLKKAPDLSLPPSSWNVRLQYDRSARRLNITRLVVKAGPLSASAGAIVNLSSASAPTVTVDAVVDDFPLDQASRFTGYLAPLRLEGRIRGRVGLTARPGSLQIHRGSAQWRGARGLAWGHAFGGDIDVTASDELRRVDAAVKGGTLGTPVGPLSQIVMATRVVGKDLKVEGLRFQWGGSDVRVKALVRNYAKPKEVVLSAKVDRLQWESLSAFFQAAPAEAVPVSSHSHQSKGGTVPQGGATAAAKAERRKSKTPWVKSLKYSIPERFPDTAGRVEIGDIVHENIRAANFVILWELRGVTSTLKNVKGGFKVTLGPGRLSDIPALQNASKVMKASLMPFVFMHRLNNLSVFSIATAIPKTMDFDRIAGEYEFAKGEVKTRYYAVDSPQMVAYSDGKMDFAKETVDMNILTKLTRARAGTLPELYIGPDGLVGLKILVDGDLNDPKVSYERLGPGEFDQAKQRSGEEATTNFKAEEKIKAL
ncbi:MAG: AsmA family protein [Elusimicrobia bacterium]|nr:AsmA family protein [Elusimicrobiota bacterium]